MSRVQAGKTYLIIGSANGPKGPSVGRKCVAKFLHGHEHSLHGPIWRVASADGMEFVSEHGGIGMEVDCAEDWLMPIDDPENGIIRETEKELTTE